MNKQRADGILCERQKKVDTNNQKKKSWLGCYLVSFALLLLPLLGRFGYPCLLLLKFLKMQIRHNRCLEEFPEAIDHTRFLAEQVVVSDVTVLHTTFMAYDVVVHRHAVVLHLLHDVKLLVPCF